MVNSYGIRVPVAQTDNHHLFIDGLGDENLIVQLGQQSELPQLTHDNQWTGVAYDDQASSSSAIVSSSTAGRMP